MERRVLVVEDDAFVGGLLCNALSAAGFEPRLEQSAAAAKRAVAEFDPDAALLDVDLGDGPNGIDLARVFERTRPELVVIMLTAQPSEAVLAKLPSGVGFVRKSLISEPAALVAALDTALRRGGGGLVFDEGISPEERSGIHSLSNAQREVLRLIALGLTNAEISKRRAITRSGAEQAVGAVFKALGLQQGDDLMPRVEAARLYIDAFGLPRRSGHDHR